jgi:uncharacterized protein (TIGR03067 family)
MRGAFLLVPTTVLLLGAGDADNDTKHLQGTWSVVMAKFGGKKAPENELKDVKVIFQGNLMTLRYGREEKGTFKLDPSKKPKAMDVTLERKGKKETALFIYELDGGNLKLCWRKPGGERPTSFTAKDTDGVMVLKRSKKD